MNKIKLADAVRTVALELHNSEADADDVEELLRVLARVIEGKSLDCAFGAPGDWGYESPIGSALAVR